MSWVLNKLEKITDTTYLPGDPGVPGTDGTAGTPGYCYWKNEEFSGGQYFVTFEPPEGYDTVVTLPTGGGNYMQILSDGWRNFDTPLGTRKAYLIDIVFGQQYRYYTNPQTLSTYVCVGAVAPVPGTPGIPSTPAQLVQNFNLGWNTGARGPDSLSVNEAVTWRFSASNVGSVVGVSLAIDPQDNGYAGMALSVMTTADTYRVLRGPDIISTILPFNNNTKFALARTNTGTIELYVNGGLIHTEALALDVVVDTSLYSGGDQVWDTIEIPLATLERTSGSGAVTVSNAVGDGTLIKVTKTVLLGTAGAVTRSDAVCGAVLVNGVIFASGGAVTVSDGVGLAGFIVVEKTILLGTAGAVTNSAAVAVGDPATGVGISTRGGGADISFLPLTAAAGVDGVNQGWTGNYQGDSVKMLPMDVEAFGGLIIPSIGLGECIMVPMSCSGAGITGEVSTSADMAIHNLIALGSSEATYGYGNAYMHPLIGYGSDGAVDDVLPSVLLQDRLYAYSEAKVLYVNLLLESVYVGSLSSTFYNTTIDILNEITALATQQPAYVLQVAEEFTIDYTTSFAYIAKVAETLRATGVVQTFAQGFISLLSTMLVVDNAIPAYVRNLTDEIDIESLPMSLQLAVSALSEMTVTAAYQNTMTIIVEETVEMQADDTIELTAQLFANLLEHTDVYSFLKTPADIAHGWVVNTEGDMPISEYSNYNFNSLAPYKGRLYGTNDAGLYLMGADTDDGAEIAAEIKSLMLDFGTSRLKRMRSAYMGYTSTGDLVLKVRSVDDGQLTEQWYKACPITAVAPRTSRMLIGQGLRSRYWQFELVNVDGADFELDQIEMHPLITNRRV